MHTHARATECVCLLDTVLHVKLHIHSIMLFLLRRRRGKRSTKLRKAIHTFPKLDIKCNGLFYGLIAISISKYDFFCPLGPVLYTHYSHPPSSLALNTKAPRFHETTACLALCFQRPPKTDAFLDVYTTGRRQNQRQSQSGRS